METKIESISNLHQNQYKIIMTIPNSSSIFQKNTSFIPNLIPNLIPNFILREIKKITINAYFYQK